MKFVALCLLILLPVSGLAVDISYNTYGGFDQTVDAFRKIALIFHDEQYISLVGVFSILGVLVGGMMMCGKMSAGVLNGSGTGVPLTLLIIPLFGSIIFRGMVIPVGHVNIFDTRSNQTQTVGNVPDLIVLAAGLLNRIERGVIRIIDNNAVTPYERDADALSFKLFYDAVLYADSFSYFPPQLIKSLERYHRDCVPLAMRVNPSAINTHLLNSTSGSDNDGLFYLLAKAKNGAAYTIYYDDAYPNGLTLTCSAAWSDHLSVELRKSGNYAKLREQICRNNGFSGDLSLCNQAMTRAIRLITARDTITNVEFLRNTVIATVLAKAQLDENPDRAQQLLTNKTMIMDGIAKSMGAEQWFSITKATATAIILGLFPLLMLFMVTPLFPKILNLTFCLFAWLALWGICDAMMHQSTVNEMLRAFAEVQSNGLGLKSVWLVPTASMKAMALFAHSRSMTITIATFLATMLFGINAYALSNFARGMNQSDDESVQASRTVNSPQHSADMVEGLARANATFNLASQTGFSGLSQAASFQRGESVGSALEASGRMHGEPTTAGLDAGYIQGATAAGRVSATGQQTLAGRLPSDTAYTTAMTNAGVDIGQAQGKKDAATELDYESVGAYAQSVSYTDTVQSAAHNQAVLDFKDKDGFDRIKAAAGFDYAAKVSGQATTANMISPDSIQAGERVGQMQGGKQAGELQAAEQLSNELAIPGGVGELQRQMTATDTREHFAKTKAEEDLIDKIGSMHPKTTDAEAVKDYGKFMTASQRAEVNASAGDPDKLLDYKQQEISMSMQQQRSYVKALEAQGLSPAQAKSAVGTLQAVRDGADRQILQNVDTNALIRAAVLDSKFHVGRANHIAEMAEKFGGIDNLVNVITEAKAGREFAQSVILSDVAGKTGHSMVETAMAEQGASMRLAVKGEDASRYLAMGLLTPEQADTIKESGGGSIDFSYMPNPVSGGHILASTVHTGKSTREDNSELHDHSYRDELGVTTGYDSLFQMSMDPGQRQQLSHLLNKIDNNTAQETRFIQGLASNMDAIQSSQSASIGTVSATAGITNSDTAAAKVDSEKSIPGKIVSRLTGVWAEASESIENERSASTTYAKVATTTENKNFDTISQLYHQSEYSAFLKAKDFVQNHYPDLPSEKQAEEINKIKYDAWAKQLQNDMRNLYSEKLHIGDGA